MYQPKYKKYHQSSRKLTADQAFQRLQLLQSLAAHFPYISQIDEVKDSYYYSNQLLNDLFFDLTYILPENQFISNPQLKKKYDRIYKLNQQAKRQAYQYYYQQQQQQQQQAQYAQQGYSAVGYGYGQQGYYPQQNQNYQYNQGQQYNQYQNQQQPRSFERRSQQGGNYREQRYNQETGQSRQVTGNNYNRTGQQGYRKRDNYERGHHNHYHHSQGPIIPEKKFLQDEAQQYSSNLMVEDEVTHQPEPVIQAPPSPPPPPPKPQPKPTKFSITQIKDFINSFSKQELQKHTNPDIITKVKELSEWKCEEVEIQFKEQKRDKNPKKDQKKTPQNTNITFRADRPTGPQPGYKPPVSILIGAKETLETRQIKEQLKKNAADFAEKKLRENELLDSVQKSRKQIVFNLNLIVPENLKEVEKDLVNYLFEEEAVCKVLVDETIKKAWDQPKYASTYAKLCQDFNKINPKEFKFEKTSKKEKDNPFKLFVVESVQHSFDQKIEKFPVFQSQEDKDQYLKDFKKRILSNVKFIAELIICKVLKKRIIRYCISQMFQSFLNHFYAFVHDNKIEDSVYDYHYEGIIEFIENIGEKYDSLDQKQKQKEQKVDYNFSQIQKHIQSVLKTECPPNKQILDQISSLTANQYFDLLQFVDQTYIRKKFPRLGALLQNLIERRQNKWEKHLSMADGPKKLKDIQEDIEREERGDTKAGKEKKQQEQLEKKVKEMFEGWQMDKHEQLRGMKDILRKNTEQAFYLSLLRQAPQQSKDVIIKRITLFPVIMDYERFKAEDFKNAWAEVIKEMVIGGEDFPFCTAAYAKIIAFAIERGFKLGDFHKEFEDQQQTFFSEEVIHKYYYYTKDQAALKIIKPKAKYRGLL